MTDENRQLMIDEARRTHDRLRAQEDIHNDAAIKSGSEGIKALILANGGAIVAVLAFFGNIAGKESIKVAQLADAAHSLVWFACGIVAGLVCMLTAYLTNLNNANTAASHKFSYAYPHAVPNDQFKSYSCWARFWQWASIATAITSLGFFGWGIWMVRATLLKLGVPST